MIINKKESASRIKFSIMISTLVYLALLVVSLVFGWSEKHIFEYCLTGVFVIALAFTFIKKYQYIYYNSDGPKIILRYSPLQPLTAGNFAIEIPKRDFVKAELLTSLLGLRKSLIFYVKTPQGVAKFKPVSLTILKKDELNIIMEELSNF